MSASFVFDLISAIFGDPVVRDVDDYDLPLPEHRNNTEEIAISDEPEMRRTRLEKAMPGDGPFGG